MVDVLCVMTGGGGGGGGGGGQCMEQMYLSLSHLIVAFLLGIGGCFLCNDRVCVCVGGGGNIFV